METVVAVFGDNEVKSLFKDSAHNARTDAYCLARISLKGKIGERFCD